MVSMLRLQLVPVLADLGVESVGREVVKSGGRLRRYRSRQELHAYRPRRLAYFCITTGGEEAHDVAPEAAQQQAGGGDGYGTAAVDHIPRRRDGRMWHAGLSRTIGIVVSKNFLCVTHVLQTGWGRGAPIR